MKFCKLFATLYRQIPWGETQWIWRSLKKELKGSLNHLRQFNSLSTEFAQCLQKVRSNLRCYDFHLFNKYKMTCNCWLLNRKLKKHPQTESVSWEAQNPHPRLSDWLALGNNLIFEPHVYRNQYKVCSSHGTQYEAQREYKRIYRLWYILCLWTKLQWKE